MENHISKYGARKGKQNALRRMLSSVAANNLKVFPVPGFDVLLAMGFNPNQKGISIAATQRHANVVLVTTPLPGRLIPFVAHVYAQMPRPRLMVFVGMEAIANMPSPDFVLSVNEINSLKQIITLNNVWSEDATPYEPSLMNKDIVYTCPMHPEVQSDNPGKCPECGMVLVIKDDDEKPMDMQHGEVEKEDTGHGDKPKENNDDRQAEVKDVYTCPMYPEVQSDKPGKCPKCGMALVIKGEEEETMDMQHGEEDKKHAGHGDKPQEKNDDTQAEVKNVYTCPMHPKVQSDKPGKCPKCGMAMVKKEEAHSNGMHGDGEMHQHQHLDGEMKEQGEHKTSNEHQHGDGPKSKEHSPHKQEHPGHNHQMKEDEADKQDGYEMKGHYMKGHEGHGDMEGMEGMDGMDGGFMSMVQMTKDMPRGADGLAMEMNDVFFGPFHPGLPGGLVVKMKLDGDTVMIADIKKDIISQRLLHHFPEEPENLARHIAKANPVLHQTFKLLVYKALTNISGKYDCADEVNILEKDRILHHLNWLSTFSKTIGSNELHHTASGLCYAMHAGNAKQNDILNLVKKVEKTLYLKRRLSNISCIPDNLLEQISGPLARAAGKEEDARLSMPAYHERNFKPVVLNENNGWGQLLARLGEIEESMALLGEENLNRKFTVPEIVINDYKGNQKGEAILEAPNGKAHLQIELEEGKVKSISLEPASAMLATLVPEITKGKEIADALVSIAALNISPWELDLQ